MAQTAVRGQQVLDGTIQRDDLDVSTVGQAVVAKLLQGSNITLTSTGADSGTGDVTISAAANTGPAGPAGSSAYTTATAGFTVPAVGSSVVASVADTSWVVVGETLWVQDANGTGSAGSLQVTAKTANSLTLQNVSGAGN